MPEVSSKTIIQRVSLTLFFCLIVSVSSAQTPISCGQVVNGSIATQGEKDTYTFTAQANDSITIRILNSTHQQKGQKAKRSKKGTFLFFKNSLLDFTSFYVYC